MSMNCETACSFIWGVKCLEKASHLDRRVRKARPRVESRLDTRDGYREFYEIDGGKAHRSPDVSKNVPDVG